MDPTETNSRYYPPQIKLITNFFSVDRFRAELGHDTARVVTSIAMFYDLESPLDFMQQIREVLAGDGIWVFSRASLPTMLKRNSYDTVCHEHLEYYALKQILWMAASAGLKVLDVDLNDVNGGSFRVFASRLEAPYPRNETKISRLLKEESDSGLDGARIYREFAIEYFVIVTRLAAFSEARKTGESILGYGASTKGNVMLQFCELTIQRSRLHR